MAEKTYTIWVGGLGHVVAVDRLGPGRYSARLTDGRQYEVSVAQDAAAQPAPTVAATAPSASAAPQGASESSGSGEVTAPMPGVVLSVEVSPGSHVTRGQTLLVLEAMKMRNDIRADRDGVVASIPVSAGDEVSHGDLLLAFEG